MKNTINKIKENKMKTLTQIIFTLTILIGLSSAQSINGTSSNYGGNTTYHRFNDGTSGTSSNYGGNTTYHRLNDGTSGTSSNYGGNTTYHNW